jgi:DNA-binding CsgD family transcriptional regulator
MMRIEDFAAISRSRSLDALRSALERLAGDLEFDRYALQVVEPGEAGLQKWTSLDNVPAAYLAIWNRAGAGKNDPVMQHAKVSNMPRFWGRETYERVGLLAKWEEQEPHGYAYGLMSCTHLAGDRHVLLGLERAKQFADPPERLTHKMAVFQLFHAHVVDPSLSVMSSATSSEPIECPLTKRELEVLQWTLDGKTAREAGRVMGIAERTAALHAHNATFKLNLFDKHQAALKAFRLGWISPR